MCGSIASNGYGACTPSPAGGQCKFDVDCAGVAPCVNGQCLRSGDASCSSGAQCASSKCTGGKCYGRTNGERCAQASDCRSAQCGPATQFQCFYNGMGPCVSTSSCQTNSAYGAPCETQDDCGAADTVCTIPDGATSGTCIYAQGPTLKIGEPCPDHSRCISGRCGCGLDLSCNQRTCQQAPGGQACSANSECMSNSCFIAQGTQVGTCSHNADGGVCESALDCMSARCTAGKCAGSVGAACTDYLGCGSSARCGGKCQAVAQFDRCNRNDQCSSGFCDTSSGYTETLDMKEYTIGTCRGAIADGDTCYFSGGCESGECAVIGFFYDRNTIGKCDRPTGASLTCSNQAIPAGAACTVSSNCISNSCSGTTGKCDLSPTDGYCYTDNDCEVGSCQVGTKTCKGLSLRGRPCKSNSQCNSNYCNPYTNKCSLNSAVGGPCDATDDCRSGTCVNSVCTSSSTSTTSRTTTTTSSSRSSSTTSTKSSSTASTTTRSSTTTKSPSMSTTTTTSTKPTSTVTTTTTKPATSTTTKPATTSSTTTRRPTTTSTPLPSAASCTASTQCQSGYCRKALLSDGKTRASTGTCDVKKANNSGCYTNEGCVSGVCSTTTKTCTPLALNVSCTSNAQCGSAFCNKPLLSNGTRDSKGSCAAQKAKGGACYQNGGCTSGSCNLTSKLCN
ncbi:hypothetical protein V8E36_000055 [Tilletia maclaganii]